MMCPISGTSYSGATYFGECQKEKCAWWSASHGKCAVLVMATQMDFERVYRPESEEEQTDG